ncbi:hypothetical protein CFC21_093891 [Triticum aestivum]|uniref:Protein kinase domain-containing protein n=2 Tax=Triticum aestivum TaxID=4565 RepID=A0A9R1LLY5_WHEAT|nr:hypothetical protein CFC21_093886 [Triticum aestivum]KAF7091283.1 hypothetical protein CFC21_093891 [Triticum aestivum]
MPSTPPPTSAPCAALLYPPPPRSSPSPLHPDSTCSAAQPSSLPAAISASCAPPPAVQRVAVTPSSVCIARWPPTRSRPLPYPLLPPGRSHCTLDPAPRAMALRHWTGGGDRDAQREGGVPRRRLRLLPCRLIALCQHSSELCATMAAKQCILRRTYRAILSPVRCRVTCNSQECVCGVCVRVSVLPRELAICCEPAAHAARAHAAGRGGLRVYAHRPGYKIRRPLDAGVRRQTPMLLFLLPTFQRESKRELGLDPNMSGRFDCVAHGLANVWLKREAFVTFPIANYHSLQPRWHMARSSSSTSPPVPAVPSGCRTSSMANKVLDKMTTIRRRRYEGREEGHDEVAKAKPHGPPAVIWSLGCTVLEMLTAKVPYPDMEWVRILSP